MRTIAEDFVEEVVSLDIEEGHIKNEEDLEACFDEHLLDLVSHHTPYKIIEENENYYLGETLIADEVVGFYRTAYELCFDVALEIMKMEVKSVMADRGLLKFKEVK